LSQSLIKIPGVYYKHAYSKYAIFSPKCLKLFSCDNAVYVCKSLNPAKWPEQGKIYDRNTKKTTTKKQWDEQKCLFFTVNEESELDSAAQCSVQVNQVLNTVWNVSGILTY